MQVVRIRGTGGPEVLTLSQDAPEPTLDGGPGQVRVRVVAAGLNRADLLQAKGRYPAPPGWPADIPGLEFAGEVLEVAPGSGGRFGPGDKVMGLLGGGAFAEQIVTWEELLLPIPEGLSVTDAAAIPEAFATAYDAAFLQGGVSRGQALLVHAVGSGVGTAALQLGRALGCEVIGTARTQSKLDRCCAELGLAPTHALHVPSAGASEIHFAERVRSLTGGRGADVCLELVGGAYVPESLRSLAPKGRLLLVGLLAGANAQVDLGLVLSRRLQLRGTTLRSRTREEKADLMRHLEAEVLPLFSRGAVRPLVESVLPMRDVRRAAERMASNELMGKVVVAW